MSYSAESDPIFPTPSDPSDPSDPIFLDFYAGFATLFSLLNGSAYPEWPRGQALRRHSNLVQVPRC